MNELFICLSILAAVLSGIGVAMERKGLSQLPEITPSRFAKSPLNVIRSLILCRVWFSGWIIAQLGWVLTVQAFYIGDFNVVKTLSSLSIVVATLLGVKVLGEELSLAEKTGIVLVTGGTLLVSLQAQVTKPQLVDISAFILFNGIALTLASALMVAAYLRTRYSETSPWEVTSATAAGIFYSVSTIFQYLATYRAEGGGQKEFNLFSVESWASFILNVPFIMGYAILLLGFFSFQSAMSRGRASIAYPISTSLGIALPVLGSVLIFGEMIIVPTGDGFQFPLSYLRLIGIIVTIIGGTLIQTHSWRIFSKRLKMRSRTKVVKKQSYGG